ncbi:MAG: adenylate/guanylate cyclase domain-containing protein, partial [Chloroflexi bacterium]|nr:adenylate/guanylate cyclase domain-containing protein [Chloroflexota bacterium]
VVFGLMVYFASRMESNGVPGCIQVSADTYGRLSARYIFEDRGIVEVKGKGPMQTYLLLERAAERTPVISAGAVS